MSVPDISTLNEKGFNKFAALLGIEFVEMGEGKCSAKLDVQEDLFQPGGIVHGGAAFSLADSTMAHALISVLTSDRYCSTIDMNISFLGAVTEGVMTCEASVVKCGRRVAFLESKVFNGQRPVATATATFMISQSEEE